MPKISFEIEIPQGYYTKEALENLIQNKVSKIVNTPINAYSSTEGNITIPFEKLFCDNGGEQKELEKRVKEIKKQKEEEEKQKEEIKPKEDDITNKINLWDYIQKASINGKPIDFKNNNILIPDLMEFLHGEEIKPKKEEKEEELEIEDDFKKDMELLNELFEEKSRFIKKNLEILKKLNVISDKK